MRNALHLAALLAVASLALHAREGACQRSALDSNDFVIDTYSGIQLGSLRLVTLGGAYAAIAERSQGIDVNPASVAQRVWFSQYLIDYDAGYAYLAPGLFLKENMDYDNDGDRSFSYKEFFAGTVFGSLRAGPGGGGAEAKLQRFILNDPQGHQAVIWEGDAELAFGYSFKEDLIVMGAGVRFSFLNINVRGFEKNALSYLYTGFIGGVLFRFKKIPLRIGLSTHLPIPKAQGSWTNGVVDCPLEGGGLLQKIGTAAMCESGGLIIPQGISHPWSVRLGFAYFIGKLPWNEGWTLEKRNYEYSNKVPMKDGTTKWSPWQSQYMMERSDIDRRYVLLAVDVEVVGGTHAGIGMEGFLTQQWKTSTESPTVSIHGGIEAEVWANMLVLRAGGYAEPSRFKRSGYRGHGTFGFDLKLFSVCWGSSRLTFRGSAGFDAAPGYFNLGLSVGFWK